MKKIVCVLFALLMVVSLGACKVEQAGTSSEGSETASVVSVNPDDYTDNLTGLAECLQAAGYISGDPLEMEASFIGAENGRKYAFTYNNSAVTVEIYEYAADKVDSSDVLKSVDETGKFTVLSTEVEATHAGRYLMIYSDSSDKEENTARRDAVLELFRQFAA